MSEIQGRARLLEQAVTVVRQMPAEFREDEDVLHQFYESVIEWAIGDAGDVPIDQDAYAYSVRYSLVASYLFAVARRMALSLALP